MTGRLEDIKETALVASDARSRFQTQVLCPAWAHAGPAITKTHVSVQMMLSLTYCDLGLGFGLGGFRLSL